MPPAPFTVESGACATTNEGTCVASPNYPSSYGNDEECQITLSGAMTLTATAFNTEGSWDKLFICQDGVTCSQGTGQDGVEVAYSGDTGPTNVVTSGPLRWRSDYSNGGSGWEGCAQPAPPSSPPSPPSPPPRAAVPLSLIHI